MTSAEWEEATEVDIAVAKPAADTEPAPPPTAPQHARPEAPQLLFRNNGAVDAEVNGVVYGLFVPPKCELCGELFDHDPACPHCPAVEP